jgi:signal transduction histidine kinase
MLGLLAAEVAHEIRNPLTSMKMLFHSLDLRFPEADPRRHDAGVIAEKMDQLNHIVDRLLGYARSTEPTMSPVAVDELLADVLLLARTKLGHQGVTVEKQLAAGLPLVNADRGQVEQACLNLILNAAEAMPGGGKLTIATSLRDDAWVVLSFTDTGVGISPKRQADLFQPFLTTKPEGTGLGLAIVQKIMEAHRGRIEVESVPGQGTTFRLVLPV